jgi:hypothetical protein
VRTPDDSGDDRLDGAFAARAETAPRTLTSLANEVQLRVAKVDRRGARAWPWLAAAAAVVALVFVVGGTALLNPWEPGASGPPATGSDSPPSAAAPTSDLRAALGDPIGVEAALAIRNAERGNRELLVEGFLSPPAVVSCPSPSESVVNPTRPKCPESMQWLMDQPERLTAGASPVGPAFQPSFALVQPPTFPPSDDAAPLRIVVVGHFHDRRAALCEGDRALCDATFLVDRVFSVDGVELPVATQRVAEGTPKESEPDVDALVAVAALDAIVVSRQLVTLERIYGIEPVLMEDPVVPHFADQTYLTWIVTTVDLAGEVPLARTFALIDGTSWFAEIGIEGAVMLERAAPGPSDGVQPVMPSGDPKAFDSAPTSVLGLTVYNVGEVADGRRRNENGTRDEFAVRGWYVAPPPGVQCSPPQAVIHAVSPPCDEARHWLLDDPSQYGVEHGQLRSDPERLPSVLNPLLPVDVPFEVGDTWRGDKPIAQPVVVLGHFNDNRARSFHGSSYFVVDALVWTDGEMQSIDRLTRLTTSATEDPAAVVARIEAASPNEALASWVTVVDVADFATLEPYTAEYTTDEFTSGTPVWIVRRLIADDDAGRPRFAVEVGITADHADRVWWTPCPDCELDLATSLDIRNPDASTEIVRVFDYDRTISVARAATALGQLAWHRASGNATCDLEVAHGAADNVVVVRWRGPKTAPIWHLEVREFDEGWIYVHPTRPNDGCGTGPAVRRIVLVFDHPVDLRRIAGNSCCG